MKSIFELSKEINENAEAKGFWELGYNLGEKMLLIVTEVAEMCEAHRVKKITTTSMDAVNGLVDDEDFKRHFLANVKDSFEDEMADVVIRVFDMAYKLNIPLEKHIIAKMRYNKMRPYKHGKAY